MAMTLRLDDKTSEDLREIAQATGRSQQLVVQQALRDFLWVARALANMSTKYRFGLRRAFIARPISTSKRLYPELRSTEEEAARDARYQAMIDAKRIKPATGPRRPPPFTLPTPPGGSLSLLDREDRV